MNAFAGILWVLFAITGGATIIMATVVRLAFRRRKSILDL